ncbi:hypothetical protein [Flavobacterium sp. 9AF]|uniref:hypothetical protein n=1 Tax=Flavobacterium sp. 9AF TaxID=2653142 RepID=UPI001356D148|nr:hypothetical protein [Flavobacterium sp. 9AF]
MKNIIYILFFLSVFILFISCSNELPADHYIQRFSRNISFKIIGEYSGELSISYSNPNDNHGVTPGEITTVLPWQKDILYNESTKLTGLSIKGSDGLPNEIVQLLIYADGELIETEFAIADENGKIYGETSIIYFYHNPNN